MSAAVLIFADSHFLIGRTVDIFKNKIPDVYKQQDQCVLSQHNAPREKELTVQIDYQMPNLICFVFLANYFNS